MRLIPSIAVAIVLSTGAGSLAAQVTPAPHAMHAARGRMDPLGHLLELRQQLGLTADQVSRLEAIRGRVQAQNQPLLERLSAARQRAGLPQPGTGRRAPLTEEQRQARQRFHEQNRATLEQLRQNMHAAMQQVHGVLTDAQRRQLRELHQGRGRRGHQGHFHRG